MELAHDRDRWRALVKDIYGLGCGGMDWMELAQDRDRWRALVKDI